MSPAVRPSTRKVASQHFPITVNVEFTLQTDVTKFTGQGRTITLSASQFSFACEELLPSQGAIRFSIAWPAKLNETVGLNLCGSGRFLRTGPHHVTVDFSTYEFRTRPIGMRKDARFEASTRLRKLAGNVDQRVGP